MLETDSLFHLANGVSHGLGCAVVSAGIAATAQQLFKLPCQPLVDASAGTIAFITRKHSVTPAMKAFLGLLQE
ncbi:LysR substrate binding domain protein [compost metagenome]